LVEAELGRRVSYATKLRLHSRRGQGAEVTFAADVGGNEGLPPHNGGDWGDVGLVGSSFWRPKHAVK
jgi:hypothetical protein